MHLLFDEHYEDQVKLVDALAERIQILGGVAVALPQDVAEMTRILRPPKGREEVPVQLSRLLEAHETILTAARDSAARTAEPSKKLSTTPASAADRALLRDTTGA